MDRSVRRGLLAAATVTATTAAMLLGVVTTAGATDLGDPGIVRSVPLGGNLGFPAGGQIQSSQGLHTPEVRPDPETDGAQQNGASDNAVSPTGVPIVTATPVDGSPGLTQSFHGLDGFDQRFANGGNQFSVEPPDQALCVGNG